MAAAKKQKQTSSAARKRAAPLHGSEAALAEAAWAEADLALAEALVEFEAWQAGEAEAATFVGQAIRRAARRRGLSRIGAVGALEPYDDKSHALIKAVARPPIRVRILSTGVARGGEVLVKARAEAIRRRK
jgi:hypothetical protein